ncbi:hypothetical protein ElyMa_002908500 [Elysia marginata]|uniref:Uncharacterized protein n=1 Tax=Elysia marginata TaxID=1093978 RepID=A0AAV4I5L8_9GAST|nr:hypothetical protein ElyMa_002908500 [Elysia marginata]
MQSSQGHRSICSCIVGFGRNSSIRIRPIPTYGHGAKASHFRCDDARSFTSKITALRVSPVSSKFRQSRNAQQGFLKRRSPTPLRLSTPLSSLTALQDRSAQRPKPTSFSSFAPFSTGKGLLDSNQAPQCKNTSSSSHYSTLQGVHQGLDPAVCPRSIPLLNTRPVSTTSARWFGASGKGSGGGGGGTPNGNSNGPFRTHNYQFMNTSRNIFGHQDG